MKKLEIKSENGKFLIRDEDGNRYGAYDTRVEAEENLILWIDYYEREVGT